MRSVALRQLYPQNKPVSVNLGLPTPTTASRFKRTRLNGSHRRNHWIRCTTRIGERKRYGLLEQLYVAILFKYVEMA